MRYFWVAWAISGRITYGLFSGFLYLLVNGSTRVRVQIVVVDEILLVKEWLGNGRWRLPGGGVNSGETLEQASVREVEEELKLSFSESAFKVGAKRQHRRRFSSYNLVAVAVYLDEKPELTLNRYEINAYRWFKIDSPEARQALISPN